MRLLVVEDEPSVAHRIIRLTREILGDKDLTIKHYTHLDDANDYIASYTIDLLLLDLNLQGLDGFELLKQGVAGAFHTIVVSANVDRAIEAFEYGVLDFVAKPFTKARLQKALARFGGDEQQVSTHTRHTRYLSIKKAHEIKVIALDDVEYFKAADAYSEVYLTNGEVHLHDKSLNKLESILPPIFERVHRSYISRMNRVSGIKQTPGPNYELALECGFLVPVSRGKAKTLKQQFV